MKSFIDKLLEYDVIGFDMDGTLYDEFDFISQAYQTVAEVISEEKNVAKEAVYSALCLQWLSFGSSKTTLFQDVYAGVGLDSPTQEEIEKCVRAYRSAQFRLRTGARVEAILSELKRAGKTLFLITDGDSALQRRKMQSLGLERWFQTDYILISGDYGKEYQKPSPALFGMLPEEIRNSTKVLYVGDREVDRLFAKTVGIDFIKVNMLVDVSIG